MKFKNILLPMALLFTNINFGLAQKSFKSTETSAAKTNEAGVRELFEKDLILKSKLESDTNSTDFIRLLEKVSKSRSDIAFGFGSAYLKSEKAGRESLMDLLNQYVEYNSKRNANPKERLDTNIGRALFAISSLGQSTKYEQAELQPIFNKLTELASKLPEYIREERSIIDNLSKSTTIDKNLIQKERVVKSWGELLSKISSFSKNRRAGETKTDDAMDILEYIKSITPPGFAKQLAECNA